VEKAVETIEYKLVELCHGADVQTNPEGMSPADCTQHAETFSATFSHRSSKRIAFKS